MGLFIFISSKGAVVYYREGWSLEIWTWPPSHDAQKITTPLCYLPQDIGVGDFKDLKSDVMPTPPIPVINDCSLNSPQISQMSHPNRIQTFHIGPRRHQNRYLSIQHDPK